MKTVPRWKYWLSYLYDIPIESCESEINEVLHLVLSKGRFQLFTDNAIYSYEDLYDNFFSAFKSIRFDALPENASVLILGYGMASIPLMLEKKFARKYQYTGIELDEEIIDMANRYISPRIKSSQEVICGDADIFLKTTSSTFDIIIVDVFIDDTIPVKFEKVDFLAMVKEKLRPNGLVLYNRLANDDFSQKQAQVFLDEIFTPIFNKADKVIVDDNWIICSNNEFLD